MTNIYLEKIAEQDSKKNTMGLGKALGYAGAGAVAGNAVGLGIIHKGANRVSESRANALAKSLDKAFSSNVGPDSYAEQVGKLTSRYDPILAKLRKTTKTTSVLGAAGALGLGYHLSKSKE